MLLGATDARAGAPTRSVGRVLFVDYRPTGELVAQDTVSGPAIVAKTNREYQAQGASGPALEFSQRFGRWFGYTAHLSFATLEVARSERTRVIDAITTATLARESSEIWDETTILPLFGVFDVHFLPPGRWDLYAGPLVGFAWYDDLFGGWVDDHFLYGLGTGCDLELGSGFALSAIVRFIQAETEPREGGPLLRGTGEINVDPWQLAIGVAYRFGGPSR
jgi:hypothetical protein